MHRERTQRIAHLVNQLIETIMTAAICAQELRAIVRADDEARGDPRPQSSVGQAAWHDNGRPFVDASTLTLVWAGKSCPLGCTILFRLADRLSRRPNQYITSEQLLRDVWDGDLRSPDTIRSAIRHLRERLTRAGMGDLASAIQGRGGRYGLILREPQ